MYAGPFVITELPRGWAVSWPGYERVLVNNPAKLQRVLKMLFEELNLSRAQLGVSLNNGELETYSIDSALWYTGDTHARDYLTSHIVGHYVVEGVKFDAEDPARYFLDELQKRYIWMKLGGTNYEGIQ